MKLRYLGLVLVFVAMAWTQARVTVDVDTGNCVLSGTNNGGIGFTSPDTGQGMGFQYPKGVPSVLYAGAFLVGASATTVHDHFYGVPATALHCDWVERDTFVDVVPPLYNAHEMYQGAWVDTTRPTAAEGYKVTNTWFGKGLPAPAVYGNFVIFCADVRNISTTARNGVYVGVMIDFDLGTAPTNNWGRTDVARRLTYMWPSSTLQNPTIGVKLLTTPYSNGSLIDHAIYVYPATGFTEQNKFNFLNGTIRLPNTTRAYDYSIMVSGGPYNIAPNASVRVGFAIIGGDDSLSMKVGGDTAQAWWDRDVAVAEENVKNLNVGEAIRVYPNPFNRSTRIFYTVPGRTKMVIKAFDRTGREVAAILDRYVDQSGHVDWNGGKLPNGVYFLRVETSQRSYTEKVLLMK